MLVPVLLLQSALNSLASRSLRVRTASGSRSFSLGTGNCLILLTPNDDDNDDNDDDSNDNDNDNDDNDDNDNDDNNTDNDENDEYDE